MEAMELTKQDSLQPRKIPRQKRSIALVKALQETCLRILKQEGTRALTVSRLAEESGVAVTSIYEYFPTIEAVIAAVLRSERESLVRDYLDVLAVSTESETLRAYLLKAVRRSISVRQVLIELHPEIYQFYIDEFDATVAGPLDGDDAIGIASPRLRRVIEQFRHEVTFESLDDAAYLTARLLQAATRAVVVERNLLSADPGADQRIAAMLYSMLTAPVTEE